MTLRSSLMTLPLLLALSVAPCDVYPSGTASAPAEAPTKVEFTEEYLASEENVTLGRELWVKQCRHCHGASAYPGKAPKLKPRKYTADFVYDRVTNGFRKMPAWEAVFTVEERKAIVAFVKSRSFSP